MSPWGRLDRFDKIKFNEAQNITNIVMTIPKVKHSYIYSSIKMLWDFVTITDHRYHASALLKNPLWPTRTKKINDMLELMTY